MTAHSCRRVDCLPSVRTAHRREANQPWRSTVVGVAGAFLLVLAGAVTLVLAGGAW